MAETIRSTETAPLAPAPGAQALQESSTQAAEIPIQVTLEKAPTAHVSVPEEAVSAPAARAGKPSERVEQRVAVPPGFKPVRGVHLTAWAAGAASARRRFLDRISGTLVNAVVVPVKETDGRVYIPGVASAHAHGTTRVAIPRPREMLADMKERGLYTVARIVVFKDDTLPRKRPEWGVHDVTGGLWKNAKGVAWVDPYRKEVWEYNLDVALHAVNLGFDEVQFDYIRFPSDGDIRRCLYSRADHSSGTAVEVLTAFLRYAHDRLAPSGTPMSVALFGLTTSAKGDMGIGQDLDTMADLVDSLSPMMYPSHYAKGAYGLKDPNREPYKIVLWGLRDAKRRLGRSAYKLRPYLQDFSLGFRYGPEQVRAELMAARDQGIDSWIFWNPQNRYHWGALSPEPPSPDIVPPRGSNPAGSGDERSGGL
ncbi:MAG: putative glycoside hydrolase [Elusimicrobiota bacterium]